MHERQTAADPARGRFRSFLLTCFQNSLRNYQKHVTRANTANAAQLNHCSFCAWIKTGMVIKRFNLTKSRQQADRSQSSPDHAGCHVVSIQQTAGVKIPAILVLVVN